MTRATHSHVSAMLPVIGAVAGQVPANRPETGKAGYGGSNP